MAEAMARIAHALGMGFRVDVAWLGFIERTMLSMDVAKSVNVSSPWQVFFSVMHPF